MSPRNFVRVFLKDTGSTPARFIENLRVEAARRRLEESDKLEKVANDCGFRSLQSLRRSYLLATRGHLTIHVQVFNHLPIVVVCMNQRLHNQG
jgi:transcriptional regulator GlxA family with amidase domain